MKKWLTERLGGHDYRVLNMDHPDFVQDVIAEIDAGEIGVYYDTRWKVSAQFSRWLDANAELFQGQRVLIVGCGVGTESLVVARYADQVWCNDWSPAACRWCERQLRANELPGSMLCGSFLDVELPEVDWVIGSFLIYHPASVRALTELLRRRRARAILANEPMPEWGRFLRQLRGYRVVEEASEDMEVGRLEPEE